MNEWTTLLHYLSVLWCEANDCSKLGSLNKGLGIQVESHEATIYR